MQKYNFSKSESSFILFGILRKYNAFIKMFAVNTRNTT